jgi:L-iditol 2-dehydrogenase
MHCANIDFVAQIHLWKEGSAVGSKDKNAYIMGHECAGEIVRIGRNVVEWREGDKIAIKPGLPCLRLAPAPP